MESGRKSHNANLAYATSLEMDTYHAVYAIGLHATISSTIFASGGTMATRWRCPSRRDANKTLKCNSSAPRNRMVLFAHSTDDALSLGPLRLVQMYRLLISRPVPGYHPHHARTVQPMESILQCCQTHGLVAL